MSVVAIEKQFQRLYRVLFSGQSNRLKLTHLQEFLTLLNQKESPLLAQSYYQELAPYFIEYVSNKTLMYRSVDFLDDLWISANNFKAACPEQAASEDFPRIIRTLKLNLAQTYFYLGEWRSGIHALDPDLEPQLLEKALDGLESPGDILLFEHFEALVKRFSQREHGLHKELIKIANDWKEIVASPHSDRVWTLLIEKDSQFPSGEKPAIGTIQPLALKGAVRPLDSDEDLILFNNRSLTTNDLIYQQAQDAVTCARDVLGQRTHRGRKHYKLIYSFPEKAAFYTGDSLGLGMGFLNIAVLSELTGKPFLYRLQQGLAVTGSLDILGSVRPIGEQSLKTKLEAAFFSPFSAVVLPEKNKEQAEKILSNLSEKHPLRRLQLHSFNTLKDCLRSSAVILKKKVPLAKRVISRSRRKYIRFATGLLLITLLVGGIYLLTRDTNPAKFEIDGKFMRVFNMAGKELWRYDFGYELTPTHYVRSSSRHRYNYLVEDLDGNGKNEVVIGTAEDEKDISGAIYFFKSDGTLLWKYQDHPALFFGDEVMDNFYNTRFIYEYDFNHDSKSEIIAVFGHRLWYPCRIVLFDLAGHVLSEYWHSGVIWNLELIDIDNDDVKEIIFYGTNNDFNRGIICVLEYGYIKGHSPQDKSTYTPVGISPGTERNYIRFPSSNYIVPSSKGKRDKVKEILNLGNNSMAVYLTVSGIRGTSHYTLDYEFNVLNFDFSDGVYSHYGENYGRELNEDFSKDEIQDYFRKLEFWDGDKWVTEPTENKYWRDK